MEVSRISPDRPHRQKLPMRSGLLIFTTAKIQRVGTVNAGVIPTAVANGSISFGTPSPMK